MTAIPNKDFVLRYDVTGQKIGDAVLTHRGERGGYFTLILQPPDRVTVEDVTPKELVFVLDTSGAVSVQVTVDERGNVISASVVSGHPLLGAAAIASARQARFSPTLLSGRPVKTRGVIVYNFDHSRASPKVSSALGDDESAATTAPTPEEQKHRRLLVKLHPQLVSVIERSSVESATPDAEESKFIRDGKAEVQVWLSEKSPQVLAQLKQLGFELILDPQSVRLVIGRLPIEKLAALVDIKAVRFVAPQK